MEVERGRVAQRSPGIEDINDKGLSPQVFRVSVRESQGYLGYLTTFFNVPAVFGSIPYQSNNYIGADCCDVLTSAYGKWKGKDIKKDYNVDMLVSRLSKRATAKVTNGVPDKTLKWGKDVRPGDLIAVKYVDAKRYQHIGALYSDADKNGALSEGDLIIHAGPWPLHFSYLKEGGFDGHVVILDPKLSVLSSGENQPTRVVGDRRQDGKPFGATQTPAPSRQGRGILKPSPLAGAGRERGYMTSDGGGLPLIGATVAFLGRAGVPAGHRL